MSLLKKSLEIVNSSLTVVLLLYFLNIAIVPPLFTKIGLLAIVFLAPVKIFIFGGLYATLSELASEEEFVFKESRFLKNALNCWKYYFAVIVGPPLVYSLLQGNHLIRLNLNVFFLFAHIQPFLLCVLAMVMVNQKYIYPFGLGKRKIKMTSWDMLTFLGLFILSLLIFYLPYSFQTPSLVVFRIAKFLYLDLNALTFVYATNVVLRAYPEISHNAHKEKEIYLINPLGGGIIFHLISMFFGSYPPLFVVLKALTPKHYTFREFNRVFWRSRYYAPGKLVAITCFSSNCMDAYRIAREFKKCGSTVIMGGPHVTYFPDEALEYCDSVVCGEVEGIWPQIIQDYEQQTLQKKYLGVPVDNCHELVYQELLNSPPAVIKDFLETSRGCKFHCHFCTVPSLSQGWLRKQNLSQFIELVKKVKTRYHYVVLIDNNIYSDPAYTKELFLALKPLKIKWSALSSIDIAKNTGLLELAKESGCREFLFGFEITEGSFEKYRRGKFALSDHYITYARKVKKLGIKIKAQYIFGFESDRFRNLFRYWRFCFAVNPFWTVFSLLTPLPGSQFYDEMARQDRITNLNWSRYGCQTLVFEHPRMNSFLLAKTYPLVNLFFLLTTSKAGYVLLFVIILGMVGII